MQLKKGTAPAPGAVGRALAAHTLARARSPFRGLPYTRVRREGAPNNSRGGCGPPQINCLDRQPDLRLKVLPAFQALDNRPGQGGIQVAVQETISRHGVKRLEQE